MVPSGYILVPDLFFSRRERCDDIFLTRWSDVLRPAVVKSFGSVHAAAHTDRRAISCFTRRR